MSPEPDLSLDSLSETGRIPAPTRSAASTVPCTYPGTPRLTCQATGAYDHLSWRSHRYECHLMPSLFGQWRCLRNGRLPPVTAIRECLHRPLALSWSVLGLHLPLDPQDGGLRVVPAQSVFLVWLLCSLTCDSFGWCGAVWSPRGPQRTGVAPAVCWQGPEAACPVVACRRVTIVTTM